MSNFLVLIWCVGVYGGGDSSVNVVNVPIWTDTHNSPTTSRNNNNVVSVPIWTDVPANSQRPIPVQPPAYSTPQLPTQAYSPPAVAIPVSRDPQPSTPAYSAPNIGPQNNPPAYSNPVVPPTPAYSPPALPVPIPSYIPPTPAYSSAYPITREAQPPVIQIPVYHDPLPPTPLVVQVPIYKDPVPPARPPSPAYPIPSPPPLVIPVPIYKDPLPPTNFPPPPPQVVIVPIWTDVVPTPAIVPVPVYNPPSPGYVTFPPAQVPTPVIFPFPDPPTPRTEPTTVGPRPVAPTNQRPTRVRPVAPSLPPPVMSFAKVYSVTPASVCSTVRRNLKITGSGFLNPIANFTCLVTPSCDDNLLWKDRNGHVCQEYVGMICDADATANCRKSCGVSCPRVACQDRDEFFAQCASLRDQGRCITDPNRMMVQCPVTCNFCGMFPAFVISDSQLACQAPALGGQGNVALDILRDQSILVGGFRVQSYDCQNNETSDPSAVSIKDLAGIVARPIAGGFNPADQATSMQFYVENIGLLNLTGPIMLYTVSGGVNPGRRLLDTNAAQAVWCAPDLSVGMIVSCSIIRYISAAEREAQYLVTSVWAQASFQGSIVNSTIYTFKTTANTLPPSSTSTPFINVPVRASMAASDVCRWTESASCWPWWAWFILALLLLLILLCCCAAICGVCKRNSSTTKKDTTNYVYRRPRPQPSPPVAHSSPSPHLSQEIAHGPAESSEREARVAYHTMGHDSNNGSLESPAVRLVFNTASAGPFEVRGPEPEAPSHFVFEERGSANSLSHSPTAGRRSISYSQNARRDTRDHVVFNEAT